MVMAWEVEMIVFEISTQWRAFSTLIRGEGAYILGEGHIRMGELIRGDWAYSNG